MHKRNTQLDQHGALNVLLFPLIFSILALVGALAFGGWAFSGKQDYKNNTDQKIVVAVTAAKKAQTTTDNLSFAEQLKNPFKTYNGPSTYGSVSVQYPRSWSAYVNDTSGDSAPIDGFFAPDVVPSITDLNSTFSLRVKIVGQAYAQLATNFSAQIQQGNVTISAFKLAKVPSVVGIRVDGQIEPNKTGSMIVLPLRDKTLEVYTESKDYLNDFNNYVLPNLTFVP